MTLPTLLAIDPGTVDSAYVVLEADKPIAKGIVPNAELLAALPEFRVQRCVIEMVASYGMPVGAEVFETVRWIGRFEQRWTDTHVAPAALMFRRTVKLHLCGQARAKDANIRQALLDRYGPGKDAAVGRKANPGPLYGFRRDEWAALALAVTFADTLDSRSAVA